MSLNKNAQIRYREIDRTLRKSYPNCVSTDKLIENCSYAIGKEEKRDWISKSTFEKDIHNMKFNDALDFNAPIEYNSIKGGYCYTDPTYTIDKIIFNWEDIEPLLFAVSTLRDLKHVKIMERCRNTVKKLFEYINLSEYVSDKDFYKFVQIDTVPYYKGSEYLSGLVHALKDRFIVKFDYKKFGSRKIEHRTVEPYLLKEYKNRWYLIGWSFSKNEFRTFALDRFCKLEITDQEFLKIRKFNPKELFQFAYGITTLDEKPEKVVLSFTPEQGNYIKTQPIHHSQKKIIDNDKEYRIELKLIISKELKIDILSWGSEVKVLQPKKLKEEIKSTLKKSLKNY